MSHQGRDGAAGPSQPCLEGRVNPLREPALEAWGVYIHIPFCPVRCTYCDFPTVLVRDEEVTTAYVDAVIREWSGERIPHRPPLAVYLGGGTPSLLGPDAVDRLLGAIRQRTGSVGAEVTLEANPGTVDQDDLNGFRQAGITRLSIGVQALQDRLLREMNRGHGVDAVLETLAAAKRVGFPTVSMDAIYGWPGQTWRQWQETVEELIRLEPDHVSLYQLQVEPGTQLYRKIRRHELAPPNFDEAADMADWASRRLTQAGLARYEISSFARPGRHGRMNQLYWTLNPYVGLGMAAHAFDGRRRWWNARSLHGYLNRVRAGRDPVAGSEELNRPALMREYCWLGLRQVSGLTRQRFGQRFGADALAVFHRVWEELRQDGLITWDAERIALTARGLDLANLVMGRLIGAPLDADGTGKRG